MSFKLLFFRFYVETIDKYPKFCSYCLLGSDSKIQYFPPIFFYFILASSLPPFPQVFLQLSNFLMSQLPFPHSAR